MNWLVDDPGMIITIPGSETKVPVIWGVGAAWLVGTPVKGDCVIDAAVDAVGCALLHGLDV